MQEHDQNSSEDPPDEQQRGAIVWFIRHGESEALIGKAATHSEEIRLTQAGRQHAEKIATMISRSPDLIVSSSYLRAWETALPTLQRYAQIPHTIWPVHEFTYLGSQAGVCSTRAERRSLVEAYWERCEPTYQDGTGESFAQFISRARTTIDLLKQMQGFILIFTHEQFIRASQGIFHGWLDDTPRHMRQFRQRLLDDPLPYGYILDMHICPNEGSGQERFLQREYILR
jgi:broad specificity phosphatase PhoE